MVFTEDSCTDTDNFDSGYSQTHVLRHSFIHSFIRCSDD